MRLLYLTDRLSHRGGAPNHLLEVIGAMAERNRVVVASAAQDKNVSLPATVEHVTVPGLRAGTKKEHGLTRLYPLLNSADLVHIQNIMNPVVIELAKRKPCVATIQDHRVFCPGPGRTLPDQQQCSVPMEEAPCVRCLPNNEQRSRMVHITQSRQRALRGVPLIVLSAYMADEMEGAGFPRPTVIPPKIRIGPPKEGPGDGFLMAGRMVHHKGVDMGYHAWKMANTQHPLRIAGLGPAVQQTPEAEHLGWLSGEELRVQIRAARALIFPSRWQEPYGIIGVEALANGTPVIAMKRGGMGDWMGSGCINIQPGDVNGMAAALKTMAHDPGYAQRIGKAGQAMMRHRQHTQQPTERIRSLYEKTKSLAPT